MHDVQSQAPTGKQEGQGRLVNNLAVMTTASLRIGMVAPFATSPHQAVDDPSGIGRQADWLAATLTGQGHRVSTFRSKSAHEHGQRNGGVLVGAASLAAAEAGNPAEQGQGLTNGIGPEVDLIHGTDVAMPSGWVGDRLPTVVTAYQRITPEHATRLEQLVEQLGRRVHLVAVSETQRAAAPHLPWASTISPGIPVGDYPFTANKSNYCLLLGPMQPQRRADLAIQAAHAAGLRIVLVGPCPEPDDRLYRDAILASRWQGDEWIDQVDERQRRELLASACCLLHPTFLNEPFLPVLAEALACGTPVVARDRGAAAELVDDGITGILCSGPSAFVTAVRQVDAVDPKTCRVQAEERFGLDLMAARYVSVYRDVLERGAAA